MKHVKSTDPRKPFIVAAFRALDSHANKANLVKVTSVVDLGGGRFRANLHESLGGRAYAALGSFETTVVFLSTEEN